MNHAKLESSIRLDKMHQALWMSPWGATTRQLARMTGSCAVHTDISELRANGVKVSCVYEGLHNGRRRYRYRLEET